MFGVIYTAVPVAERVLRAIAAEFSPRAVVEDPVAGEAREVSLDVRGLTRIIGDGRAIAHQIRRVTTERGLQARVAVAGTRMAARLLVHGRPGLSVAEPGRDADMVSALPLAALLAVVPAERTAPSSGPSPVQTVRARRRARGEAPDPRLLTFTRWGLRTLGDFTRLPAGDVAARLGQQGVAWQRIARGEDLAPLVPDIPEERFEQAMDLEWPIEGLEPLSFVLARLIEPLSRHLEQRGRGAAVLHVRLHLVTREVVERTLELPAPMREAKTLRTLAMLDLESHPPGAAIDRVVVAVDPTPARVLQHSLLARPLPTDEQRSTLLARLTAVMGEGRCGSPIAVDSWRPGAFAMRPFAPKDMPEPPSVPTGRTPALALRRCRMPVPLRVRVEAGVPVHVTAGRRGLPGGRVTAHAGPWRTSGAWWEPQAAGVAARAWDREEWEVALADRTTCLVFRERGLDAWFLDGVLD